MPSEPFILTNVITTVQTKNPCIIPLPPTSSFKDTASPNFQNISKLPQIYTRKDTHRYGETFIFSSLTCRLDFAACRSPFFARVRVSHRVHEKRKDIRVVGCWRKKSSCRKKGSFWLHYGDTVELVDSRTADADQIGDLFWLGRGWLRENDIFLIRWERYVYIYERVQYCTSWGLLVGY